MCLAIPGKLIELTDDSPLTRRGRVDFSGVVREVNLTFVPEAALNDYVLVHVGVAINTVDEAEAQKVFAYLEKMDELDELKEFD